MIERWHELDFAASIVSECDGDDSADQLRGHRLDLEDRILESPMVASDLPEVAEMLRAYAARHLYEEAIEDMDYRDQQLRRFLDRVIESGRAAV